MRTRVNFKAAVGKTVEAVHEPMGVSLLVLFTDGTYAHVVQKNDDDYLSDSDYVVRPDSAWEMNCAVRFGLLTTAEAAEVLESAEREKAAEQDRRDRAEFERLKAKFGPGTQEGD